MGLIPSPSVGNVMKPQFESLGIAFKDNTQHKLARLVYDVLYGASIDNVAGHAIIVSPTSSGKTEMLGRPVLSGGLNKPTTP